MIDKEKEMLCSYMGDFLDSYRKKYSNKTIKLDKVASDLARWIKNRRIVLEYHDIRDCVYLLIDEYEVVRKENMLEFPEIGCMKDDELFLRLLGRI